MKILHTADLHLRSVDDARWKALGSIISLAREQGVGLIAISGDMFDRQIDAQSLKVPLRDLFNDIPFHVVILPGNHDARALSKDDYYGENVTVLGNPEQYLDLQGVRVFGLPFEKVLGEKVLERLLWIKRRLRADASNIVLYHGELLDIVYRGDSFGEEEGSSYMPVRLPYFDGLGIDYVLAGHFHSNFEVQRFREGYFVYPGSPVSITRKETGPRSVNLFDVGHPPQAVPLDTEHYHDVVVRLNPFSGTHPLGEVQRSLEGCHPNARVLLTVTGFVDLCALGLSEQEFAAGIDLLNTGQVEAVSAHWVDISAVVENELFQRFVEKLDAADAPQDRREETRELVIESMMEALHAD